VEERKIMRSSAIAAEPLVRFDPSGPSLVINSLIVEDAAVIAEARLWSQGRRGPAVTTEELVTADLSNYVVQALVVGAHAIGTAGGVQQTYDLKDLVAEVGERTAQTSKHAAEATDAAIAKAAHAMEVAAAQTRTAIGEAGKLAREDFRTNVEVARTSLTAEINRLLGGENPELLARLQPVLERFGRELDERSTRQTSTFIEKVARQFDPADPASVLAQQNRMLTEQHRALTETMSKEQAALAEKVNALATAVHLAYAAESAAATTAQLTPLKGETFAQAVHRVMSVIAAGLGDEYVDTSGVTGLVSRSKKGDGVLTVEGGEVRVVVEMSDSPRGAGWADYLAEAERNRGAHASIGVVRSSDQLRGSGLITLGARRIVLAYDPENDSPELLRTVVQLVRLAAVSAARRDNAGQVETADEKINEALENLTKIDDIEKTAGLISKNVLKIASDSGVLRTEITRLLKQAAAALVGAKSDGTPDVAA
jgi:hypothetical protein